MIRTYKAILHGDHVEWIDKPPEQTHPLPVHITPLEDSATVKAMLETRDEALADFHPVPIRGEALSATVLRERR